MNSACLTESIIPKASVSAKNLPTKYYYGVTEGDFKTRWRNHKTSLTNANYNNVTELSHYICELRDKHGISYDDINISWGIEQRTSKYVGPTAVTCAYLRKRLLQWLRDHLFWIDMLKSFLPVDIEPNSVIIWWKRNGLCKPWIHK